MVGSHFKNKIIFTLITLIIIISVIFITLMNFQQQNVLSDLIQKEKEVSKNIYDYTLKTLYEKYLFIASSLLLNEGILKAVAEEDHHQLLVLTQNYYEQFKKDNPYLDVMHFHTPQTHSLLRLHRPKAYGDDLSILRPLIVQTNKEQKPQIGLEVGKYGIDYRVAVPINYHGKHIGVLEFGVNAEYVINILSKNYELESILLLDEKKLSTYYSYNKKIEKEMVDNFIIFSTTFFPAKTVQGIDNLTLGTTKHITYFGVDHIVFKATDMIDYKKDIIGQVHLIKNIDFFTSSTSKALFGISLSVLFLILTSYLLMRYAFNNLIKEIDTREKKLIQKNHLLEKLINIDHLTKALNRRRVDEILNAECKRAQRYNDQLSIILFDIDNFKLINDTYGHNNGDKVLRILSKTVSKSIRDSDFFGRWGGEEFIIVTTSTNLKDAVTLAEKIRTAIASTSFDQIPQVTCSFGVAACTQTDSVEQIVHKADEALYQAKAGGKNCVVTWDVKN